MKLLLFDIDGTLLMTHGLSKRIFCQALSEVFGVSVDWEGYTYAGQPDRQIGVDLLARVGIEEVEPDRLDAAFDRMGELWAYTPNAAEQIEVFESVVDVLNICHARLDLMCGIVTANSKITAEAKLNAAGLEPHRFEVGAYGDEAFQRADLPPLAIERANQIQPARFSGQNTIVIGDSPADIRCAQASGALSVAITTGFYSREQLQSCAPDLVIDQLDELLDWL